MRFSSPKSEYEALLFAERILRSLNARVTEKDLLKAFTQLSGTLAHTLSDIKTRRLALESGTNETGLEIFCDGSIKSDKTLTCGMVIKQEQSEFGFHKNLGIKGTSNQAEYYAIIEALDHCLRTKIEQNKITIYTDSNLVVRQINGEWAIRNKKLRALCKIAQSMIDKLSSIVCVTWIPRAENIAHDFARGA